MNKYILSAIGTIVSAGPSFLIGANGVGMAWVISGLVAVMNVALLEWADKRNY